MPTVEEMLAPVQRVTLQLSNICPHSHLHTRCAANGAVDNNGRQILPRSVALNVLGVLGKVWKDKKGKRIAWHVYNEPGIDPRLAYFLMEAKRQVPDAELMVWTNAWYLTEGLALELVDFGMDYLVTSPYFPGEADRQAAIGKAVEAKGCKYRQTAGRLGSRRTWGEHDPPSKRMRCFAPFNDLTIRASSQIGLCCLDCFESVQFGSVAEKGFVNALADAYEQMSFISHQLLRRVRTLQVCRECVRGR
jgi:hypothetical protein